MTADGELLRRYGEGHSEDAFAELVQRHINLVYSAALRQVNGDAHLAQDVAQVVFTDLARKASALGQRENLSGWLYTSTHFAAAKAVRSAQRRSAREQQAMQETFQTSAPDPDWEKLRPVVDQVMHELNDAERAAILLRYFENGTFAEIGEKLGLGEEAARKRVDRALEKLRASLGRRGVSTAAALGTVLSAHAVQTAPAGLATILAGASFAGVAGGTGTTLGFLKAMTMTKLQAGIIGTVVMACVLTPLVMLQQAQATLQEKDGAWQQASNQLVQLTTDHERLTDALARADKSPKLPDEQLNELLKLRGEVGPLRKQVLALKQAGPDKPATGTDRLTEKEKLWAGRVAQIKQWAEANPAEQIPELKLLTDHDWLNSLTAHTLETPEDISSAMAIERANAENIVLDRLASAFRKYSRNNGGQLPTDLSQLIPLLNPPIDDDMLQRYEIVRSSDLVTNLQGDSEWVITQKAPVNKELDLRFAEGLNGGRMADSRVTNRWEPAQ